MHILSSLLRPFSDHRIQFGIKMGIAGMVAFYIAQLLQIYNPIWALLTVMIIMLAKYVGAIAEKSLLRAIGTILGGFIAVWLVGNHIQNGFTFLLSLGIIVAFCTYRFGGTFYPYAFFLCALTMIVIVNGSMGNPEGAWSIALSRVEEILIGTLSATVVSSVLWPRFARQDFLDESREFTRRIGGMITDLVESLKDGSPPIQYTPEQRLTFLNHLNELRMLIQFGARESIYFKARLGTYSKVVGTLAGLHEAARDLIYRSYERKLYFQEVGPEVDEVYEALKKEFAILSSARDSDTPLPPSEFDQIFKKLDTRLEEMQRSLVLRNYPIETVVQFGRHIVALRKICLDVQLLRSLILSLPTLGTNLTRISDEPKIKSSIDPFWMKNGVKGAIAACVGLIFNNWLHPPGANFIPLFAWVFTVMSRGFLGGQGDRRCFHYVFFVMILGIPVAFLVLILSPYFVNYAIFNLVLFGALCAFGFSIARTLPSVSYLGFMTLNILIASFGVNFQQPQAFQGIYSSYMGTVIGLFISAVIQRTLWPVLPQWELRNRFMEFFQRCQNLLQRTADMARNTARYRITLIPSEAASWARVMVPPFCPEGETKRLMLFNGTLLKLSHELQRLQEDKVSDLPEVIKPRLHPIIVELESNLLDYFKSCVENFKTGTKSHLGPALQKSLENLRSAIQKIREDKLLNGVEIWPVLSYLSLTSHYESLAEAVEECDTRIQTLQMDAYWGDYNL
ncbi:MAG: FUSC family protein [Chthoniobacterales bacterium]